MSEEKHSADEWVVPTEIADAEFDIRFVSQKRRDEIADQNTRRTPGNPLGELNIARYKEAMADELISGWRNVTPLTAMRLGYPDFDKLPVDDDGHVPYTIPTARKLYRYALRDRFESEIDAVSRSILEVKARQKKADIAPSAT